MSWLRPLLISIFALLMMVGCQTPSAYDLWKEGQEYYQAGNYVTALPLLEQVAAQGYSAADYAVGYMYFYGQGTMPNRPVAIHYFKRAAAKGYSKAVVALQQMDP